MLKYEQCVTTMLASKRQYFKSAFLKLSLYSIQNVMDSENMTHLAWIGRYLLSLTDTCHSILAHLFLFLSTNVLQYRTQTSDNCSTTDRNNTVL